MSARSVTHSTFVIERTYPVPPARVFAAWADPGEKTRWFGAPDEGTSDYGMDFRVGCKEFSRGLAPNGRRYAYDAVYQDIVPDRRIVAAYDMHIDGTRISVSLSTVEFEPAGSGTRLKLTEQGAFLDGRDDPADRERGTRRLLDQLGAALKKTGKPRAADLR